MIDKITYVFVGTIYDTSGEKIENVLYQETLEFATYEEAQQFEKEFKLANEDKYVETWIYEV